MPLPEILVRGLIPGVEPLRRTPRITKKQRNELIKKLLIASTTPTVEADILQKAARKTVQRARRMQEYRKYKRGVTSGLSHKGMPG